MFSKPENHSRGRFVSIAAAGVVMCAFAGSATALGAPDHCIVGSNAIGCRSERTVAMLTGGYRGNGDSLRQEIESQVDSGACRLFQYGEHVYSSDVAAADIAGKLRTAVRRPGDATTYFMPASWSRPVEECSGTPTAGALERKLGMAVTSEATGAGSSADPEQDAYANSGGVAPGQARLMAQHDALGACIVKPVMTDADIAACRRLER